MLKHIGVLCILIVIASAMSILAPLWVDPRDVFLGAILIFVLYMGVSYLRPQRRPKPENGR